jgi:anti-anti-sigma factor
VKRSQRDNVVVLRVHVDLDIVRAPGVAVQAAAEIRAGHDLVIDIAAVGFMDSAGMAMLLNACRRAARAGVGFAVVCPGGPAYRSIEIARLVDTLNVCADQHTASARLTALLAPATEPSRPSLTVIDGGADCDTPEC